MKTISYFGDEKFLFGIKELQNQLRFTLSNTGKKIYCTQQGSGVTIDVEEDCVRFFYGKEKEFFRGFALALEYAENIGKHIEVQCLFEEFGTMQSCSAGIKSVEEIKTFIRQSAILGYTYIGLYTETTYEVENEPYFGYKAGKYTKDEIIEMVEYGEKFQVEIIPYIQTLGHMAPLFSWNEYYSVKDINDTLLVEFDKTYMLIENMLKSLRSMYKTNRINLGMDEAYYMGFGRYYWFIDDKPKDRIKLYIDHVKKVLALADKYGFTDAEIWHDNIFNMKFKGYLVPPKELWQPFEEEIVKTFPNVKMRFWYYGLNDVDEFDRYFSYIKMLSNNVQFASAVFGWGSFCPQQYKPPRFIEATKVGCLKNGVTDILVTIWTGKISPLTFMASFYDFIEGCSTACGYDKNVHFAFLFGYTYDEFLELDLPDKLKFDGVEQPTAGNPSFYCLVNDPLLGIMEKHIPSHAEQYFKSCAERLGELAKRENFLSFLFRFESVLCETLSCKALLSTKIKHAYDNKDKDALLQIVKSIPKIYNQVEIFYKEYKNYWKSINKHTLFAIFDNRFGGMLARLNYAKEVLQNFVNGEIDYIEELEEDRLPISKQTEGKIVNSTNWDFVSLGSKTRL